MRPYESIFLTWPGARTQPDTLHCGQALMSMANFQEGGEDDCVLCLIGNKADLCSTEESRVLKYKDGLKLAEVRRWPDN